MTKKPLIKYHQPAKPMIPLRVIALLLCLTFMFSIQPGNDAVAQTAITFTAEELLTLPTDNSITINVVPGSTIELFYEYGTTSGGPYSSTTTLTATAGQPSNVIIQGLAPNTKYYYRMKYHLPGETGWITRSEHSFHTQRTAGETFTFVVTSDAHSSMNAPYFTVANLNKTLSHMAADQPDFWVDLGDTPCTDFMDTLDEYKQGNLTLRNQIKAVSGNFPIFKALGNHEQEMGWNLDDNADMAQTQPVLASNARQMIFPAPKPDEFYSGNLDASLTHLNGDHLRADYFEWTWGDAQFIVLDPYWYTMTWPQEDSTYPFGGEENAANEPRGTRWDWSLGIQQHLWLKNVLETSTSSYKFVFIHNITGGIIPYGRGGTEVAGYFEWGGMNWDGTWGWDSERPAAEGWTLPTHELFDQYNVSVFFHGHDHFFAKQELDGVIYQEVPMPGANDNYVGFMNEQTSAQYASQYPDPEDILYYDGAEKHPDSGHIRVTVSPTQVLVQYVDMNDGSITTSYIVYPAGEAEPVLGDVNGDSKANSTDALIILSGDVGINISSFCPINCGDVNGDGLVNSTDALIVMSFDVGITVPFAVEQTDCPSIVTQPSGCTSP